MTVPTPVTIIRPKRTLAEHVCMVIGQVLGPLLAAWIVMLLLPGSVFDIAPGYGSTVLAVTVVRLTLGSTSEFLIWTKESK